MGWLVGLVGGIRGVQHGILNSNQMSNQRSGGKFSSNQISNQRSEGKFSSNQRSEI